MLCFTNVCGCSVVVSELVVALAVTRPSPVPTCAVSVVEVVSYTFTAPAAVVSVLVDVAPLFSTWCVGPPMTFLLKRVVASSSCTDTYFVGGGGGSGGAGLGGRGGIGGDANADLTQAAPACV